MYAGVLSVLKYAEYNFTLQTIRSVEDSDLEEIMSAVTRAWAIPSVNVYGFFLTMMKKMSGRQTVAWIARLRDTTDIITTSQYCILSGLLLLDLMKMLIIIYNNI